MLKTNELNALREKIIESKNEDALILLTEVEHLQKESFDYKSTVLRKLTSLETDMNRLVAENSRLITLRDSAYVERDACIGLLVKLAIAKGFSAGIANGNTVILELDKGQVSWEFGESEAHLFEGLPEYQKPIEDIDMVEKYRRVMNAGITS